VTTSRIDDDDFIEQLRMHGIDKTILVKTLSLPKPTAQR
jgi:hypothetical protein